MDKAKLFKMVNIALLISAAIQIVTSILIFSGILRSEAVVEVHEYNGIIFIVLVLIHVYLNWGWIKSQILKR